MPTMNKKIAILFSVIYLSATTQFSQVLKIPIFIEHYIEYDGGFMDYLVHHYGGHEPDEDWDIDMMLPFMTASPTLLMVFNLPPSGFDLTKENVIQTNQKKPLRNDLHFSSAYLSSIFQPPRHC